MSKCPKCGVEIDYLDVKVTETIDYTVILEDGEDGSLEWEADPDPRGENSKSVEASCPECGAILFSGDDIDAKLEDFLRGDE